MEARARRIFPRISIADGEPSRRSEAAAANRGTSPITHFASVARAVLVKGAGVDVVWPQLLALAVLATGLVAVSAWRFRSQLS